MVLGDFDLEPDAPALTAILDAGQLRNAAPFLVEEPATPEDRLHLGAHPVDDALNVGGGGWRDRVELRDTTRFEGTLDQRGGWNASG